MLQPLNQLTRKVVKPLGILLTISFVFIWNVSISQKTDRYADSVALKHEIDAILAKHGLKSRGFAINVISLNQNGGQTAYSITNNYFSDPNYIPDETNYIYKIETNGSQKNLIMSPKYGVWVTPYILYDSAMGQKDLHRNGFNNPIGYNIVFNGKTYTMFGVKWDTSCSPNDPIFINLNIKDNLIIFGDFSYSGKSYIYFNGQVSHTAINIK